MPTQLSADHLTIPACAARRVLARYRQLPPGITLQDLESDAALSVVKAALAFDPARQPPGSTGPGSWLFQHALFAAGDLVRNTRRKRRTLPTVSLEGSGAERAQARPEGLPLEDRDLAARALSLLPPKDRLLVRLYYWDGLSHQSIAARLGVAKTTVSLRLRAILERLRERLAQPHERSEDEDQ